MKEFLSARKRGGPGRLSLPLKGRVSGEGGNPPRNEVSPFIIFERRR